MSVCDTSCLLIVIRDAAPPTTPIAPDIWRKVLLATLLGGVAGCGLVLLYDRLDDVVEGPEDLESGPDALFGTIPEWASEADAADPDDQAPWPGVAAPFSPAAEAYRHLATNVRLGVPYAVETLLVTSPGAREGKTTTVANLGVALSESGRDVLLVDADLQGPSLHRSFGVERAPGLTDRLAEAHDGVRLLRAPEADGGDGRPSMSAPNGDPTQRRVRETQQRQAGRLGLLAAAGETRGPALLLQDDPVRSLLRTLSGSWDLVLFDTPPVLLYDDAFRLAALSDLVLLLAAAGETRGGAFRDVRSRLDTVCPNSVAALLNRYRPSTGSAYGYGSYAYTSYPGVNASKDRWTRRASRGMRRIVKG